MQYLIDYFMFRLKKDKNAKLPYEVDVPDILDILDIPMSDFASFVDFGSHNFYKHTYYKNGIRVYTPSADAVEKQGFCVELSGEGCRYLESLYLSKYNKPFSWFEFFEKLWSYVGKGCDLNINRIDFAFDDYNKKLDLNVIEDCAKNDEFVSLFRSSETVEKFEAAEFSVHEKRVKKCVGKTVYFGSRRSNSFVRFYDKKAEQMQKFINNKDKLAELENIPHWVRFEIVFKKATAVKLFMSALELKADKFLGYLTEVVNGYIRFVERDNNNVSRCSLKSWWADFIGTVKRAKLTSGKSYVNYFSRCISWINYSLANTLQAVIDNVGEDTFIDIIYHASNKDKWTEKHKIISKCRDYNDNMGWSDILIHDDDYISCEDKLENFCIPTAVSAITNPFNEVCHA